MYQEAIVALSHLRWSSAPYRTQHLLSRLALKRRVFFVEEPVYNRDVAPDWQFSSPLPNLLVCRPNIPYPWPSYSHEQLAALRPAIQRLRLSQGIGDHVAWLSSPLILPLLDEWDPCAIVYDCIDELDAPRNDTSEWKNAERQLLRRVDAVFTSGVSLYSLMRDRHPNVYYFPSNIDVAHFRRGRDPRSARAYGGTPTYGRGLEPEDQARLPHPRVGYSGVLDSRIDFELLDMLARTRRDWHIVLIGALKDGNPVRLPRHANLHYLGPKSHDQLPHYLAGWEVALLPFVVDESTRFLNPKSVLEYMAAERMIATTRIADVVQPYCDVVYVGHSPNTFLVACEHALHASPDDRADRVRAMQEVLAHSTWQNTVGGMERVIARALEQRRPSLFSLPAHLTVRAHADGLPVP